MNESLSSPDEVRGWLAGRLPSDWFLDAPEVVIDREEITVVGRLSPPETAGVLAKRRSPLRPRGGSASSASGPASSGWPSPASCRA